MVLAASCGLSNRIPHQDGPSYGADSVEHREYGDERGPASAKMRLPSSSARIRFDPASKRSTYPPGASHNAGTCLDQQVSSGDLKRSGDLP